MIIRASKPGKAPVVLDDLPLAARLFAQVQALGYDRVWIMVDEGAIEQPPPPSCYGSRGE